jgi:hypothetical protein
VCVCVYVYVFTCICVRSFLYVCVYMCVYVCMYVCICAMCGWVYVYVRIPATLP